MKMTSMLYVLLSALLTASVAACNSNNAVTDNGDATIKVDKKKKKNTTLVNFVDSDKLRPLLDRAEREGKLVFVDFYTDWCTPCKIMDENVFRDREFSKYLNQNFISYKVDAEKGNGTQLASIFGVQVYPTLLFVDKDGVVVERINGSATQSQLRTAGNRALASRGLSEND